MLPLVTYLADAWASWRLIDICLFPLLLSPPVSTPRFSSSPPSPPPPPTQEVPLAHLFANKTVVLFTIPGAFTSLCRTAHFPSFGGANGEALRAAGVDAILCIGVNDPFVMDAFGTTMGTRDTIDVLADGDGSWVRAVGMAVNLGKFGGIRARRGSFVVVDGVVRKAFLEDGPAYSGVSGGKHMLANW